MWSDPIVEEARAAGDRIARECNYSFHRFCERLRAEERQLRPGRIVNLSRRGGQAKKAKPKTDKG